jgi:hypothetical protein
MLESITDCNTKLYQFSRLETKIGVQGSRPRDCRREQQLLVLASWKGLCEELFKNRIELIRELPVHRVSGVRNRHESRPWCVILRSFDQLDRDDRV